MERASQWLSSKESASTGDVLDQEDPLEEEMATQSSTLAWEIPCTEETGGLQTTDSRELDTNEYHACTHTLGWKTG